GHVALRAGAGPLVGYPIEDLFLFALGRNRRSQVPVARRSLAQVIETEIGHDAVDPSVERALKAEAANIYVGAQEGFLVDVLGVFLRSGKMNRQPQHGTIVLPDQFFKSGRVAELSPADELGVIYPNWTNLLSMLNSKLYGVFHFSSPRQHFSRRTYNPYRARSE